jgi:hypothetical protein
MREKFDPTDYSVPAYGMEMGIYRAGRGGKLDLLAALAKRPHIQSHVHEGNKMKIVSINNAPTVCEADGCIRHDVTDLGRSSIISTKPGEERRAARLYLCPAGPSARS